MGLKGIKVPRREARFPFHPVRSRDVWRPPATFWFGAPSLRSKFIAYFLFSYFFNMTTWRPLTAEAPCGRMALATALIEPANKGDR